MFQAYTAVYDAHYMVCIVWCGVVWYAQQYNMSLHTHNVYNTRVIAERLVVYVCVVDFFFLILFFILWSETGKNALHVMNNS